MSQAENKEELTRYKAPSRGREWGPDRCGCKTAQGLVRVGQESLWSRGGSPSTLCQCHATGWGLIMVSGEPWKASSKEEGAVTSV